MFESYAVVIPLWDRDRPVFVYAEDMEPPDAITRLAELASAEEHPGTTGP
jgi:hypothetical protein